VKDKLQAVILDLACGFSVRINIARSVRAVVAASLREGETVMHCN
jgi:hypothetical protein